jgi:hypothetical protein
MNMQYAPLQNLAQAANTFGGQGMKNAAEQKMEKMKEKFSKQATLEKILSDEKVATTAYNRSVETATALGESQNKVMETRNAGGVAAQQAVAETSKAVAAAAETRRLTQLAAKNKGAILALRTTFKAVADSLGPNHEYYQHLAATLKLFDELEKHPDADFVAGSLANVTQNPAAVIRQAQMQAIAAKQASDRTAASLKPPASTPNNTSSSNLEGENDEATYRSEPSNGTPPPATGSAGSGDDSEGT